ncbi:peptidoglycan editing factor PgeF [Allopusillimonas ginsengisoli]|uniref:peptidoglycan editing factor PgeF n=1 Tax=Allopusillimonas ginsengisoli TaxID=453575 RepID=UPI0010212652|nr:peptidoglycan editing factor PgeF [Allopusillimonas ginsengisoli]TEA78457.1 peptidoglycan editing factor PgeF [Allopusillimonas ginsengisoli]
MARLNQSGLLTTVSGQAWPGVDYFCTTRHGGASTGAWASFNVGMHAGDDATHVAANRQLLRAALPAEPVWLQQVHGADVCDADRVLIGADADPPVADASITTQPGRVLAIMTADCLPVVIAGRDGDALGIAHAGWRGLAAGVLENTLNALRQKAPQVGQWRAWIGPAISQAWFEVGEDVHERFVENDPETAVFFIDCVGSMKKKWRADLPGLARWRLQHAGVEQIELSGLCTYDNPDAFYSYRRDGVTGRIATVAWLSGTAPSKG